MKYPPSLIKSQDSLLKRIILLIVAVSSWWAAEKYLRPLLGPVIQSLRSDFGNATFHQHLLSQSLPVDVTCLVLLILFIRLRIFPSPGFKAPLSLILKEGLFWGTAICIPTILLALNLGFKIGFDLDIQNILGNFISNTYEEFTYRVFLFSVAAYAFRSLWMGILVTALLFAIIHTQYPASLQIVVGLASISFSVAYLRSGSILAAILAHQFSDMILDTFLTK